MQEALELEVCEAGMGGGSAAQDHSRVRAGDRDLRRHRGVSHHHLVLLSARQAAYRWSGPLVLREHK